MTVDGGEPFRRRFVAVLFPTGQQTFTGIGATTLALLLRFERKDRVQRRRIAVEVVSGAFRATGHQRCAVVRGRGEGAVIQCQCERQDHRPAIAHVCSEPRSIRR